MCRGKPQPDYKKVKRAVPSLARVFVEEDNEDILVDICWALSYLSDGDKIFVNDLLNPLILNKLVKVMNFENVTLSIPCLRTIGNIVTGSDE
jgi:hypothetical protein